MKWDILAKGNIVDKDWNKRARIKGVNRYSMKGKNHAQAWAAVVGSAAVVVVGAVLFVVACVSSERLIAACS